MKILLLCVVVVVCMSCGTGADTTVTEPDTTAIHTMDTSITLSHFSFADVPDSLSGCSEYYAFDTTMMRQQQLLLYTGLGGTALIKINGRLLFLQMKVRDEHTAILTGEGYTITLQSKQVKQLDDELFLQDAEIQVEKNGVKKIFYLHGETGC